MKEKIHPAYHASKIICVCGNVVETRSTSKEIRVEICSNCHPFFTGKQKLIDTAGRVDRYRRRYGTEHTKTSKGSAASSEASADAAASTESAS